MQKHNSTVQEFLAQFLTAPTGKSPEAIRERLVYWIERANHPDKHTNGDTSKFAIADVRRKARQNVRRIVNQHPEAAAALMAEATK